MRQPLRVLHIEDDFADAMLVQHAVCEAGDLDIEFEVARTLKDAKKRLATHEFDLVLLDLRLPDSMHPQDTLETAQTWVGDTPVLILSGSMSVDEHEIPDDMDRLDKNESFKAEPGQMPLHIAHRIRAAVDKSDVHKI
ncbi:response regulator [Maricaulis sp. CAU 1757]